MSSFQVQGNDVLPAAQTPTTVIDGDVVFSGVVLLFVAVAFAFVLYHYVTAHRRGPRQATPSSGRHRTGTVTSTAAASSRGKGVDLAALRALPVTPYRARDFAEPLECAVCIAELSDGEAARFLPQCGHGFHAECVDLWLRSHPTCPLCRVAVDEPGASPTTRWPPLALPPAPPEPAHYGTSLPTDVMFWGSQDAVSTARTVHGPGSSGGVAATVIDVVETAPAPAPAPRRGDASKSEGLARLRSLRRLWSRGGPGHEVGASSTRSCVRGTAGARA